MTANPTRPRSPGTRHPMWHIYAAYGRDRLPQATAGVVATLVGRFVGLLPPLLLGLVIDAVLLADRPFSLPGVPAGWVPTTPAGQLAVAVGLIAGAYALSAGLAWVQNWGWNAFAQAVQHALRVDAYDAMQGLEMAFFDDRRTGELLSVLNNDVNQLEEFLTDGLNSALRLAVTVLGIGAIMAALNVQLALVAMLPVPVLAAFTYVFVRRIQPKYAAVRASVGALNARLENNVSGISVIKSERTEAYERGRVADASGEYRAANWDAITTRMSFFPGLSLITGLGFALTVAVGGYWVLAGAPPGFSGTLTAGAFVTFTIYTQQFVWPMAQFGGIVNDYQRARASGDRVFGLLTEEGGLPEAGDAPDLVVTDGEVVFSDVTFGYGRGGGSDADGDDAEPVIRDVDLSVTGGETLGIVGPTGSGKSTLVKLLLRLYDVDSGRITVDGQDVRDVTRGSLRAAVGYVSQEPFLFHGTIRENVAYGSPGATDEEVEAAARAAQAHEFVERLPDGYDTLVGERGVKLSGGQRQRVALARTILKDPPILVLDEATSHVDTETEALIQWSLSRFSAGRTVIAIAHRLSTIRGADEVVVLEGGRVAERGSHDDLLAADGLYANLWRIQAGDLEAVPRSFLEDAVRRRAEVDLPDAPDVPESADVETD